MAGPEHQFPLSEGALAQACEAAGLPRGLWRLESDGGRLIIEPSVERLSAAQLQQLQGVSIAEASAAALRALTQGRPLPEDWASTLRVTEYEANRKVDYLLAFAEDGLHVVGREMPWIAVPEASAWQRIRPLAIPIGLLTVAILGSAWLNREQLLESWRQATQPSDATGQELDDASGSEAGGN